VIPQTPSLVLITYRPEYEGTLARVHGAQTIALAPLSDSESSAPVGELLGPDPSGAEISTFIVARAGGNPFFAHEIVRDLVERGVLQGNRGGATPLPLIPLGIFNIYPGGYVLGSRPRTIGCGCWRGGVLCHQPRRRQRHNVGVYPGG